MKKVNVSKQDFIAALLKAKAADMKVTGVVRCCRTTCKAGV
jgi:hypothetical protein